MDINKYNKKSNMKTFQVLFDRGVKVTLLSKIDSTNNYCKKLAKESNNNEHLIVADTQTAGRGRMNRNFYSPEQTGLYMSYMYISKTSVADNLAVTAAASVAVAEAIEELTAFKPKIKWVNDIYIKGKKVCGILTESVIGKQTHIIIGIGVNLTTEVFPSEIAETASSIGDVNRDILAVKIIENLKKYIDELPQRTFLEEYIKRSLVFGKMVKYSKQGKVFEGKVIDIDRDGALKILKADGSYDMLNTGEISLRII